jgi:hypothetical protein
MSRAALELLEPLGIEAAVGAGVEAVEQLLSDAGTFGGFELESCFEDVLGLGHGQSVARLAPSAIVKGWRRAACAWRRASGGLAIRASRVTRAG